MSYQSDWRWNPQWKKAHLAVELNNQFKRCYVMACGKVYSGWYTGYAGKYSNLGMKCKRCQQVEIMMELAE